MYPILVDWGPLVIPSWHALFVGGALATFFLMHYLNRLLGEKVAAHDLARIYAVAYVGGYFGARALDIVIVEESLTAKDFLEQLFSFGGMTFYGGFIGGFLACLVYVLLRKLPALYLSDVGIASVLVGLSVGRIGCFLNGDDYGKPVDGVVAPWWAVTFPNLNDHIARYPVQLMEAAAVAMLVVLSVFSAKALHARRPGYLGALGCIGYGLIRFIVEFYRGDDRGWLFTEALSTSQAISIFVVLAALGALFGLRKLENT